MRLFALVPLRVLNSNTTLILLHSLLLSFPPLVERPNIKITTTFAGPRQLSSF